MNEQGPGDSGERPGPYLIPRGGVNVAAQRGKSASRPERKLVSASVKLDVATHAKVSAAAALLGISKSTWMERAIIEALSGIVLFDRKARGAEHGDQSSGETSAA